MFNLRAIMSHFPGRGKRNKAPQIAQRPKELLLSAARKKDAALFNANLEKISEIELPVCTFEGMTPLHLIFHHTFFEVNSRRKRERVYEILTKILANTAMKKAWLDKKDAKGRTPLHLAVIRGYTEIVNLLLANQADFTIEDDTDKTALDLAAEQGRDDIYKAFLSQHRKINKALLKTNKPGSGYSLAQIESSLAAHQKKQRLRNTLIGGVGAIMVIACPVATILAFSDIPLIGGLLASFIPGIGPIIGLVTGLVFAGLMIWAVHQKSSLKYGELGQKLAAIEAKNVHLDRLSADLNHLINRQKEFVTSKKLIGQKDVEEYSKLTQEIETKRQEIRQFCTTIPKVEKITKIKDEDWATPLDVVKTRLLTAGSFLCAFSGVLGICSGIAWVLPAAAFTSVVLAGIPVAGWIALGLALVVATSVAVWAHQVKFKPTLEEYGKARKKLNQAESDLSQRSVELSEENKQSNVIALVAKKEKPAKPKLEVVVVPEKPLTRNQMRGSLDNISSLLTHFKKPFKNPNKKKKEVISANESKNEAFDIVVENDNRIK